MSPLILIPIFNDWEAAQLLLSRLDEVAGAAGLRPRVLLVDDGSTLPPPGDFPQRPPAAIARVDVLELITNLGHQRAIAAALVWIYRHCPGEPIVIMDGDGQDRPEDVPRLLQRFEELDRRQIVFAQRTRRGESRLFQGFYHLYRLIHVILTGHRVRVGNFSVLPPEGLQRLVVVPELWNHYAASVLRARLPHALVPAARGRRLRGQSRMNFVSLVTHGLSAISVYGESVGTRLLVMACLSILLSLAAIAAAAALAFFSATVVPWWLVFTLGAVGMLALQSGTLAAAFSFITLGSRHHATFLPIRDGGYFVRGVREICGGHGDEQTRGQGDRQKTTGDGSFPLVPASPGPRVRIPGPTGHDEQ